MGVRLYDPRLGRFLQVDPIEGGSANDYDYPADPVNNVDLTGACTECDGLLALAEGIIGAMKAGYFGLALTMFESQPGKKAGEYRETRVLMPGGLRTLIAIPNFIERLDAIDPLCRAITHCRMPGHEHGASGSWSAPPGWLDRNWQGLVNGVSGCLSLGSAGLQAGAFTPFPIAGAAAGAAAGCAGGAYYGANGPNYPSLR
jgi:hypothetical protein